MSQMSKTEQGCCDKRTCCGGSGVGDDFSRQAEAASSGVLGELWAFMRHNKKWWLTPIIIALLLVGVVLAVGATAGAPFIYTLF